MDFGQLLHTAQKNEKSKDQRVQYYSTKFEPPKKEKKTSRQLSENIKKFLAKKDSEEKKKADEARKKRDELLNLRAQDKKATKRVNVMLKRTKSANQSVIQDAIDNDNTAVTLAGPMQPDEDDYGYVSQEASQFYNKMMEKYNKMPDEPKFDMTKKKVSTNLGSTKDRVRAALEKEKEDALLPHKRKRKHKDKEEDEEGISYGTPDRHTEETNKEKSNLEKPKPKPKPKMPPPPIMNFTELLKIAEKKQFEPIIIEKKEKDDERLLTKRQRREIERERDSQMRREERRKLNGRIPKVVEKKTEQVKNDKKIDGEKEKGSGKEKTTKIVKEKVPEEEYIPGKYLPSDIRYRPELEIKKPRPDLNKKSPIINNIIKKPQLQPQPQPQPQKKLPDREDREKNKISSKNINLTKKKSSLEPQGKKFPPEDVRRKAPPPPPPPVKAPPSKQFPPDVRRREREERMGLGGSSRKMAPVKKGRILDDDDSEYDSEMDDFIDDEGAGEDYSKYISEIFGYDKSRYRELDDDVDNMESSFAQQMKEEVISTKHGIREDLEEERKEEEARRKKIMMKKKMR